MLLTRSFLFVFLICRTWHLAAQVLPHQRLVMDIPAERGMHPIPAFRHAPFLAYSLSWTGPEQHVEVVFFADNGKALLPKVLEMDEHLGDPGQLHRVSRLYVLDNPKISAFTVARPSLYKNLQVHFYNPGRSRPTGLNPGPGLRSPDLPCTQPAYLARSGWCPATDCPPDATPEPTEVSHIIVHHSAGTNNANDWGAIVRAIRDLHVNNNKWDDIGYNWLIDPDGVIYEGRGDNLQGAHFCAKNTGTMGVCMLGTFTTQAPTQQAVESLRALLAWKAEERGIDPTGTSLHSPSGAPLANIAGHRDGCATECPGNRFYPMLAEVTEDVSELVDAACSPATSVAGSDLESIAEVFPVPAREQIRISVQSPDNKELEVRLFSKWGHLLHQRSVQPEIGNGRFSFSVDTGDLPAGSYFVEISSGTGQKRITRKVLIH